jgi:hypothetical protein
MSDGGEMRSDTSGIEQLIAQGGDVLDRWLEGVANQIAADVKLSMGTSPPGNVYQRRGIEHTASVAGSPPTPDTGNLRASIHVEKDASKPHTLYVADGTEYGIMLEVGTSTIDPRPFMAPAFARWGDGGKLEADARTQLKLIGN